MQAITTESQNIFHRLNIQYGYVETVDALSGEVIAVQQDVNEDFIFGKREGLIEVTIDGKTILMQKGMSLSTSYAPKNSKFSRPLGDLIIQEIIGGMGITKACKKYDITYPTLMNWTESHPEFGKALDKAKRYRADKTHDDIVDLVSRLTAPDFKMNKTQVEAIGKAADLLKWSSEKSDPTRYGNKQDKGGNGAINIIIQTGIDRSAPETVTAEVVDER